MNRRDIFKSILGLTVVGCVSSNGVSTYTKKPVDDVTPTRAPIDTDDKVYDDWLNKDEMHL